MKIELKEISVRDLFNKYADKGEEGVVGYGGNLDIRPAYQREFIYKDKQRDAVVETIRNNFPLNVMYWVMNGDRYEVLDGQQRTISICQYLSGGFSVNFQYFHNLEKEEQEQIIDYKLMVYFCEGEDKEKLDWFKTINIAGEKLSTQELRNAIYSGSWLTDAKRYFSRTGCAAHAIGSDYMKGSPIRQDYLETVIKWQLEDKETPEDFMAGHQSKSNANPLWLYFQNVIEWVKVTFPVYRKQMKGLPWGPLYNEFKDKEIDSKKLEERISTLMMDDEVSKKAGIYSYVLDGNEKHLNLRAFTENQRIEAYEKQKGVCCYCHETFEISEMEADHKLPWSKGGKTDASNLSMKCTECNRSKSDKSSKPIETEKEAAPVEEIETIWNVV